MNKLIILTFLSFSLFADTIQVRNHNLNYKFNIDKTKASLKGSLIDLSITKKKCNEFLFKSFYKDYLDNSKSKVNGADKDSYKVVINQKEMNIAKNTKFGKYLYSLPLRIQKAKKLENLNCK